MDGNKQDKQNCANRPNGKKINNPRLLLNGALQAKVASAEAPGKICRGYERKTR